MGDEETSGTQSAGNGDAPQDPTHTMCTFNTQCRKPDCPFAHQTPAAPPGVPVDTSSECTYGVACKNHKCVSRHPSPAKKLEHQQQQECKYGPNCTNPYCVFKHPETAACRNGADCAVPGCKFYHSKTACKFNPCTNSRCIYKHTEGQKQDAATTHVWTAENSNATEHISQRKFVEDENEEEAIIPKPQGIEGPTGTVAT
jgi:hypothetical protein